MAGATKVKLTEVVGTAYAQVEAAIVAGVAGLLSAERATAEATLRLAYSISAGLAAMVEAGATESESHSRILTTLREAGRPMEWRTVERMVKGADIAANATDEVKYALGVDSWIALGQVKDEAERYTLAESLIADGNTAPKPSETKSGVRQAVAKHLGKKKPAKKKPSDVASKIRGKVEGTDLYTSVIAQAHGLDLVTLASGGPNDEGRTFIASCVMLGVTLGLNGNTPADSSPYALAAGELFDWDESPDGSDDGAGADGDS